MNDSSSLLLIDGKKVIGVRGDEANIVNIVVPGEVEAIGRSAFAACTAQSNSTWIRTRVAASTPASG